MVYTGKPSRGCAVCRRRRIRCDEKTPSCSYCVKTKQKCPGYINSFDLAWRDQNTAAKLNVQRRYRRTERLRSKQDANQLLLSPGEGAIHRERSFTSLESISLVPLSPDIEQCATNLFFTLYSPPPQRPQDRLSFFEYVPSLFLHAKEGSTLKLGTLAVASALFQAWSAKSVDGILSRSYYSKAVMAMKQQLARREDCSNNEVLITVLLLHMYEVLVGVKRGIRPQAHVDGALALVKHRGIDKFEDRISQGLLASVRSFVIGASETVDEQIMKWDSFIHENFITPEDRLAPISARIKNITAEVSQLPHPPEAADIARVVSVVSQIKDSLDAWNRSLDSSWRPTLVKGSDCIPHSVQSAGLYQDHCEIYPSIPVAVTWNRYRIKIIQLYSVLLPLEPSHQRIIQDYIDDICASVPYHLGNRTVRATISNRNIEYPHLIGEEVPKHHYDAALATGGFHLIEPLGTLLRSGVQMRAGQREWILRQMQRIQKIYGALF